MSCEVELNINNRKQKFVLNKVAKQAASSVWFEDGNTVMLATITYNPDEMVEEDFVPLVVQYVEKAYAVGKIPAGFVKREQKPGDFETLTARIVDRSLRPLFPKEYGYNTVLTVMALSADEESDLQTSAMNAAAACMYLSELPFAKMVYGVRATRINGELIINPTLSQLESGDFNLFVTGTKDELLMIEFASQGQEEVEIIPVDDVMLDGVPVENTIVKYKINEINEDELVEILTKVQSAIKEGAVAYENALSGFKKEPIKFEERKESDISEYIKLIKEKYSDELRDIIKHLSKSERDYLLKQYARKIASALDKEDEFENILKAVKQVKREIVRGMILNEGIRADGRKLDEIRPITIETKIFCQGHTEAVCLQEGRPRRLPLRQEAGIWMHRFTETSQTKKKNLKNSCFTTTSRHSA